VTTDVLSSQTRPPTAAARSARSSGAAAKWFRYLRRRLVGVVAVLASLLVLTFMIVHWVPGDPARNIVGVTADPAAVEQVRKELGLTQPLWEQFGHYLSNLFHGDLGTSFVDQQPVTGMLAQRLPLTAQLAVYALVIVVIVGFVFGIAVGVLQRNRRGRGATAAFTGGSSLLGAMPEYITGTLFIYVFALTLHLLPVQGGQGLKSMIMPAISVALAPTAVLARLVRNETVSVLSQEYLMTATSKRLPWPRLLLGHVVPNVVTSTLTLGGLLLVALLGGTVITENVFNIAGLGTEIVQAILQSNYPEVQGIILVLGVIAVLVNLAVDIALGLVDPRVLTREQS
jgi:peptide/nickel transport system permease protein